MKESVSIAKFADRLVQIMEENNDTTYSLAEYLGFQPTTISRYRNGVMGAKSPTIAAIAEKYGVTEAWLMGADVDKYKDQRVQHKQIPVLDDPRNKDSVIGKEYIEVEMNADYCLKMQDDSMIGARIYNGDILFISEQKAYEVNDIIIVSVNDGPCIVRRLFKNTNSIRLHSENPTIDDIVISGKDRKHVDILGKVKYTKFEVR